MGWVDEDSTGITVRGAKMLGTGSIMANEVLVANIQPLQPGEEKYAISFAVPMGHPGVKMMSRRSYEAAATTEYDYPLSAHLDENDALIYFDEVHVPWERVFIYRDTDLCRAQFSDTYAHYLQNYQAQIRLMVKMQFLVGVAHKVAETIGTVNIPHVREQLGNLAAQAAMVKGLVYGMEAGGGEYHGYFVPDRHLMYTAQVLTQDLYPKFINSIRELAGAARSSCSLPPPGTSRIPCSPTGSAVPSSRPRPIPRGASSSSASPGMRWARSSRADTPSTRCSTPAPSS